MADPIPAYFGKNTYANLSECAKCHRQYDESGDFVTAYADHLCEDSTTVWWLLCKDCARELEEQDD